MMHLGLWLGGSTAICGIFVGGFFGNVLDVIYDTFLPNSVMPAWMAKFSAGLVVNPVNDPMTVLIIAVAIGCVHLIMGQCIHIYMGFRDGAGVDALLDVVPWWIVFGGIAALALAGTPSRADPRRAQSDLHSGPSRRAPSSSKLFGGIKSLYDITSWLSDVLSYARLMALMLATSVIAQVFNTLGPGRLTAGASLSLCWCSSSAMCSTSASTSSAPMSTRPVFSTSSTSASFTRRAAFRSAPCNMTQNMSILTTRRKIDYGFHV